jgi:hypothetical protein
VSLTKTILSIFANSNAPQENKCALTKEAEEPQWYTSRAGVFDVVEGEKRPGDLTDLTEVFLCAADFDGGLFIEQEVALRGGAHGGLAGEAAEEKGFA